METLTKDAALPESKLTRSQFKTFSKVSNDELTKIIVKIRYDDQCSNGHNSFGITGRLYERRRKTGRWQDSVCGCIHDEIIKFYPELSKYIKWHLTTSNGPMSYISNTTYHAGDRDCHGLLKGEAKQIKNGRTGQLCWELVPIIGEELKRSVNADERPKARQVWEYRPWCRIGEGKERELDAARKSAIWPEATDEQLKLPKEELTKLLKERLPGLMLEFKKAMEELGFVY